MWPRFRFSLKNVFTVIGISDIYESLLLSKNSHEGSKYTFRKQRCRHNSSYTLPIDSNKIIVILSFFPALLIMLKLLLHKKKTRLYTNEQRKNCHTIKKIKQMKYKINNRC